MTFRRFIAASALTAGLGAAGLGMALGVAAAAPGQPGRCDQHSCEQFNGKRVDQRNIADARRDHQPFFHNGQQVQPMMSGDKRGWGYWFNGIWNWL